MVKKTEDFSMETKDFRFSPIVYPIFIHFSNKKSRMFCCRIPSSS